MHTLLVVPYEWDEAKAAKNVTKHGVDFADAAVALEDEFALSQTDLHAHGEERWVALGLDPNGRLLAVVYTYRGENLRIISAREATAAERRNYEQKP